MAIPLCHFADSSNHPFFQSYPGHRNRFSDLPQFLLAVGERVYLTHHYLEQRALEQKREQEGVFVQAKMIVSRAEPAGARTIVRPAMSIAEAQKVFETTCSGCHSATIVILPCEGRIDALSNVGNHALAE